MRDGVPTPCVSEGGGGEENQERKDQACELTETLDQQREIRVHVTEVSFICFSSPCSGNPMYTCFLPATDSDEIGQPVTGSFSDVR